MSTEEGKNAINTGIFPLKYPELLEVAVNRPVAQPQAKSPLSPPVPHILSLEELVAGLETNTVATSESVYFNHIEGSPESNAAKLQNWAFAFEDEPYEEMTDEVMTESDVISDESEEAEQKEPEKQKNKAVERVLNILTYAFVILLIAGSTMFAFSNNTDKSLFGYRFYHVLTPSMRPEFNVGDMIFVKMVDPSDVEVGDIVTFHPSSKSKAFLTHRVVQLLPADEENQQDRMVTKGDFNNAEDPPVSLDAVIGVHAFTIPAMGGIIEFVRDNIVLMGICIGAIFLLLNVLRVYFKVRKQDKKNENSRKKNLQLEAVQP